MLHGVYKELQDLDSVIFSSIISPYSPSHLKISFPLYFAQAIAGEILCAFVSSHFFFFFCLCYLELDPVAWNQRILNNMLSFSV